MKNIFIILMVLMPAVFADDFTHLNEMEKAKDKVVFGEPLKTAELKGKVIVFKYWGYN